jgi:predicted anti-sigma-YlaC factor YlaD
MNQTRFRATAWLLFLLLLSGCSIKQIAVNRIGDALASGGSSYATDDDIDLVGDALPFTLKTVESLLQQAPRHKGLLLTAASGFTQYSYAWVDLEALALETSDPHAARQQRLRAKRLYLRGRDYALRAIELAHPDFLVNLRNHAAATLRELDARQVPELYWFSVAWAGAIAADPSDMGLVADLNLIGPLVNRCLELDEAFGGGALHTFMISYMGARSVLQGGGPDAARMHYERALEFANGSDISPQVVFAETVLVREQRRAAFESLLTGALALDADEYPANRLANLIRQKRARLLLAHADDLFLED